MAWASQKGSKLPTGMADSGNWFLDQSGSWACKTNFISRVLGHQNKKTGIQ